MKKRIISILLCLCMAACMLPTVAFAADTGKAIRLGTDALSKNVNTANAPTNAWVWIIIGFTALGIGVTVAVFVVRKRKTA